MHRARQRELSQRKWQYGIQQWQWQLWQLWQLWRLPKVATKAIIHKRHKLCQGCTERGACGMAIRLGHVCVGVCGCVCLLVNCNHYTVIRSFQQTTQARAPVRRRNEILKFPSISYLKRASHLFMRTTNTHTHQSSADCKNCHMAGRTCVCMCWCICVWLIRGCCNMRCHG